MAEILTFARGTRVDLKQHPTRISCFYTTAEVGGRRIIQFDMFGSDKRQDAGSQSQTMQLDADRAEQLIAILRAEFDL